MFASLRWPHLTAIAGGAGMGVGVMVLLLNKEREKFANRATFIKNAIDQLRQQPAAVSLLGNSFEVGKASLQDGWGKMSTTDVRVRVPIIGKTDNGSLYVYARKKDPKAKYKLFKIEMTFDKVAGKRLVLMDRSDEPDEPDEENLASNKVESLREKRIRIEEIKRKEQARDPRSYHPTVRLVKATTKPNDTQDP